MSAPSRRPPAVVVTLELEQAGRIVLVTDTFEDELRLRRWLRGSQAWHRLPAIVEGLLDDLDERDVWKAAA